MVEKDRISELPDALICEILTRLPTDDSVRTSVLSTRWRDLWSLVPLLDLDSRTFSDLDAFVSFLDSVFDTQTESSVHKLCLKIAKPHGKAFLLPWVDAVTTRNIQHLDIGILGASLKFEEIPLLPVSVYTCETLVHLELHQLLLVDAECFSLPCLKVLRLFYMRYRNEAALEKLISGSPVLEDIWMMACLSDEKTAGLSDETTACLSDETTALQVRSQSLKRIAIDHQHTQVVIDAPQLERLRTRLHKTKNYEIISLGFPAKVDIHFGSICDTSVVGDILTEISGVSDLVIGSFDWKRTFTNLGPLIQFDYLSRLKATFSASHLEMLPKFLESCPSLETLILEVYDEPKTTLSTVPPCLVSSLKFVELISYVYEYKEGDLNLIRYFLKNSTILEKLSLRFNRITTASHDILKEEVVAMPKCSSSCQVYVL